MKTRSGLRRHHRYRFDAICEVTWKDRWGNQKYARARGIDISASGAQVDLAEPLPIGTKVNLRSDSYALHGAAAVRLCRRNNARFIIGLEFTGGLIWKPPKHLHWPSPPPEPPPGEPQSAPVEVQAEGSVAMPPPAEDEAVPDADVDAGEAQHSLAEQTIESPPSRDSAPPDRRKNLLLIAQRLERALTEGTEAGQPAGEVGQDRRP